MIASILLTSHTRYVWRPRPIQDLYTAAHTSHDAVRIPVPHRTRVARHSPPPPHTQTEHVTPSPVPSLGALSCRPCATVRALETLWSSTSMPQHAAAANITVITMANAKFRWHPAQLDASHAPHAERTAGSHPRARRRRHAQLLAIRRSSSAGSHMRCAACVPSAVHRPTATAGLQACLRRRSWNRLLRISFGRSRSASKSMDSRSYSLPVTVHTNFAAIFHIASPVHHHEVGDEVATLPRQAGGVEFRYGSRAGGRRSQGGGYI